MFFSKPSLICPNCMAMMNEIIELRMELGRREENERKLKKNFTIAPTLYTFYKDRLAKRQLIRSASMTSQSIIQSRGQIDYSYQEAIIQKCMCPLPDSFFSTIGFVTQYLYQCDEMCRILSSEPRLLRLKSPSYVFGDFHGNMPDLMAFAKMMWPLGMHLTPGAFLFLGDYVDRGTYGLELLAYLFAQKIMLPEKVFLLRGNHEVKVVNGCDAVYGNKCFLGQLRERFSEEVAMELWNRTNAVFDYLPLAATIDDVIFCVHGGIPRPLQGLSATSITLIDHIPAPYSLLPNIQPGEDLAVKQVVTDLLWSDPAGNQQEPHLDPNGFGEGERGPGAVCYGQKAVDEFMASNQLTHILRAHEPTASGVSVRKGAKVITIFSTSKVCVEASGEG
ncbi:hypothetical protein WA588_004537 [Blastocystis sp. NMH]